MTKGLPENGMPFIVPRQDFLAALFFAVLFVAVAFLAVVLLAVFFAGALAAADLLVVDLAVVFLAGALLAVVLLVVDLAALLLAGALLAVLLLVVDFALAFFAGALVAVDLVAGAFLAVDFVADAFLAVVVLVAVVFFAAATRVCLGSFFAPDTTALRSAPALNFGMAVFLALMRSPVRGLRTQRASRTRFSKEPNPVIATFSPLATSRVIVSITASNACAACLRFPS